MPWIHPNPNYDLDKPRHFKYNNPWAVDIKAHDQDIIANINNLYSKKDTLYILGDFAYQNHARYINMIKPKLVLIKGNHDKASQNVYKLFSEVHEMGCRKIFSDNGKKTDVTLCHYGMKTWASSCHGSMSLYGHSHGRLPEFDNMFSFDVGVDVWGYAPVPWDAIVEKMKRIQDKIDAAGGRFVDGEFKASGIYDKDPNQRMLDIRAYNKEIMRYLGYDIDERMWPTELISEEREDSQ